MLTGMIAPPNPWSRPTFGLTYSHIVETKFSKIVVTIEEEKKVWGKGSRTSTLTVRELYPNNVQGRFSTSKLAGIYNMDKQTSYA